jgi:hypothetical protein
MAPVQKRSLSSIAIAEKEKNGGRQIDKNAIAQWS